VNNFADFVKTTVIGGLVVIVPLAIIAFVAGDAVHTLIEVTKPLTTGFPFGTLVNALLAVLIAALVIVAICFVAGFLLSTFLGRTAKNWLVNPARPDTTLCRNGKCGLPGG
jgi:uncharacterized membrane protein